MPISKDFNRRDVSTAMVSFGFADLTAGSFDNAIQLPGGSIVTGGFLVVDEVFNSTTNTLSIGDALLATRHGTTINLKALGVTQLTVTGYETLTEADLRVAYALTGAASTTGKARLYVEYCETDKSTWTQG
jgi:hypothetical protein